MVTILRIVVLLLAYTASVKRWKVESYRPFLSRATPTFTRTTAWAIRGGAILQEIDNVDDATKEEAEETKEVDENEDDEEEEEEEAIKTNPAKRKTSSSHKPVPVTIQTATGHKVLDHSLELTVNRSRDIASLKDSIRRQLPGRPPVATMELIWRGKRLSDTTIVDEMVDDEIEDDDEDEEERDSFGLVLQLDMVPPIDPKFLPQLQQEIPHWTTAELLEAYAANEAALYQNAATLFPSRSSKDTSDNIVEEDNQDQQEHSNAETKDTNSITDMFISEQIRQQAERIHAQWKKDLITSSKSQQLLADPIAPSEQSSLQATQVRGQRVRQLAATSVRTSLKLQLQRQFNIDWASSIRSFCLFLFFGWFGGRTPTSRAILLLGAPAVFVLQARQVQLIIKQVLYFLLMKPPGIVLSLLPAPQQKILVVAIQTADAMERIYGPDKLGGDKISERIRERKSASRIDVPLKKLAASPPLSDNELDDFVESLISEVDDDEEDEEDSESSEDEE